MLGARLPPEVLDQVRANFLGIEERLELDCREPPNFVLGVVDASLLVDPRPNLPHDLLDVDGI